MRLTSILATTVVLAAASAIAFGAVQQRVHLRPAQAAPQLNENSINRLPTPPSLPVVDADAS